MPSSAAAAASSRLGSQPVVSLPQSSATVMLASTCAKRTRGRTQSKQKKRNEQRARRGKQERLRQTSVAWMTYTSPGTAKAAQQEGTAHAARMSDPLNGNENKRSKDPVPTAALDDGRVGLRAAVVRARRAGLEVEADLRSALDGQALQRTEHKRHQRRVSQQEMTRNDAQGTLPG